MSTIEIGKQLVELCNAGKPEQAMETLYAADIVSIEAGGPANMPREMKGIEAVRGKFKWWNDNHVTHSSRAEGPYPNGDQFIVKFAFDVTNKPSNQRIKMDEMGLYTVKNGKIVREEFFYTMG